ncbi:MAG: hypothetical protein HWD81_04505 [Marivivens sp.]|jgi:hypothetical protein|nr:hypothetical protein [Marivivens sp.]
MNALTTDRLFHNGAIEVPMGCSKADFMLADTYWGYVIRSLEGPSPMVKTLQAVALFVGAVFALAAVGLWLMPSSIVSDGVQVIKIGLTVFLAVVSAFCFRYATRGAEVELEFDTNVRELREVVRNHAGRPSLIGRYDFKSFSGLFIDRERGEKGHGALMLRYRNSTTLLEVAYGPLPRIEALRDRLGKDLIAIPA